ncbi:MAG: prepilin-type N-terminal cleavage/methylation domain-containing protein [Desulfobacterales bacterium]|nr:prepilin-type N-terminal cleavage/methylation domain-containing protein [Desulfobacterales bacterium]MDD4072864.1 prepilin-type N-terminal cleavage/methylation domain-containing protein [Desulfobacterales bacterium]MDD4392836.1 prepilin-type N-terminal cleavage/methylation domain-containing protein [Desulfobacterales bacterium]
MKNNGAGFTLLEFIIVLLVAAIMASMLYTYFGSALTQSSLPVLRFQKSLNLDQVMENIIADYNELNTINLRSVWQKSTDYRTGSVIIPTVSNGHYYKCTTAGTSGSTEPEWLKATAPDETVTDGDDVIWKEIGTILYGSDPAWCLKGRLEADPDRYDPDNSGYTVVPDPGTRFIKFIDGVESGVDSGDELDLLKVTITISNNDTNETLTQIFTIR